jgi:hypothetical protein
MTMYFYGTSQTFNGGTRLMFKKNPPLRTSEKFLVLLMIPVLMFVAYAIGSKIVEGKRQGLSFIQIINK